VNRLNILCRIRVFFDCLVPILQGKVRITKSSFFIPSRLYTVTFIFLGLLIAFSPNDVAWLFDRYVLGMQRAALSIQSISYYKETDLATGEYSYVTKIIVLAESQVKEPIDLRLMLEDGTVIDTTLSDTSCQAIVQSTIEFVTNSKPEWAELDPSNKFPCKKSYSHSSLTVNAFFLPVIKWSARIFNAFQNLLLSTGALV
jgi:hypothetical protein